MDTDRKRTLCGTIAALLFLGSVGVILLAVIAVNFLVRFLDEATASVDAQPTGVAFFESTGGLDFRRIPLIEPYQAISTDGQSWQMRLQTDSIRYQFSAGITRLDVIDRRAIAVYASDELLGGVRENEVWYVVIPAAGVEKAFTQEDDFLAYLDKEGITQPGLADIENLYDELVNQGCLKWFPEEYRK